MNDLLQDAAELIARHVDRSLRGAVYCRVYDRARRQPVNRSFIWLAERRERIDAGRRERGRTFDRQFVPVEECRHVAAEDAAREQYPEHFFQRLTEPLDSRERAIVWCLFVDEMPQKELARVLGVTEPRIPQLVHQVRHKLLRRLDEVFPGMVREVR